MLGTQERRPLWNGCPIYEPWQRFGHDEDCDVDAARAAWTGNRELVIPKIALVAAVVVQKRRAVDEKEQKAKVVE